MSTLRDALADWTDRDGAEYKLALALGLMDDSVRGMKWVFWSNNPIGTMLSTMLRQLIDVGALEYRDDPGLTDYQERWNSTFRGGWEEDQPTLPVTEAS